MTVVSFVREAGCWPSRLAGIRAGTHENDHDTGQAGILCYEWTAYDSAVNID